MLERPDQYQEHAHRRYWFRPVRFWKWFAAYYPVTWEGWFVAVLIIALGIGTFLYIDSGSHSTSDTLIRFAPFALVKMLIFDLFCLRVGEYPHWWGGRIHKKL